MICVRTQRLIRGDLDEKIKRWEVWFQTPVGTCKSLPEAVALMDEAGIDPRLSISAISVAITDTTHEVWAR